VLQEQESNQANTEFQKTFGLHIFDELKKEKNT